MKQWISCMLLLMCSLAGFAQSVTDSGFGSLSPEDQQLVNKLIGLVDEGMSEAVVPDFDRLAKKYPKNYYVQYERLYNLYMLGRYDEVIKDRKSLLSHKSADEGAYQIIGNAYDMNGDRKMAAKIYKEGIKRFPRSGSLYMELGTINLLNKDYNDALECYNDGILAQPDFASNYYRAANLYLSSEQGKVWGLVYAETAFLLAPSNDVRHGEVATWIVDCLKENIKIKFGENDTISVKLVPQRTTLINDKTDEVYLAFPGIYEGALSQPLIRLMADKEPFTCSLPQLIEIRRGLVESYFSATDNLYGSSMYLLEFQKKIIDAGHWDAYNYFLFMLNFPEEFKAWYSADSAPLQEFIDWYNKAPFTLGDGRSVNPMQIYDHYRPTDMIQAIMIQGKLLTNNVSDDPVGGE